MKEKTAHNIASCAAVGICILSLGNLFTAIPIILLTITALAGAYIEGQHNAPTKTRNRTDE